MRTLLATLFLLTVICSCSSSSKRSESLVTGYTTQVVDSISFNRLSEVELLDYNDKTKELLVSDEQTREVFILNEKGEIVSSFQPYIEGPNYVENNNFGWTFFGDDELVAYGRVYFHRLSKDGTRLQRMEYPVQPRGWVMLDYNPQMIESVSPMGNENMLLAMIPGVVRMSQRDQSAQDTTSIMFVMDFKTGSYERVLRRPEESLYRTSGAYYGMGVPIIKRLDKSTLAVTYAADTSLFIYDLSKDQFVRRITVPTTFQPVVIPASFESKDSPNEESVTSRLFSTGEQIVLEHMGQIPEEVYKQIMKLDQWWESPELEAAVRQYMKRKYSLYSREKFLGEIEWTVEEGFFDAVNTESGFVWVQRTYKDERDYRTFLKVKIVPAEE